MQPTHPRRRSWPTVLLLVVAALLVALAAVVLIAPPAGAHPLGGVEPSNYRARVLAVRPPLPGLSVEAVDAAGRLRLVNARDREVVVLGDRAEPWLRVGPGRSLVWHEHRATWAAAEPPAQVRRDPRSTHLVVAQWTVPLRTGGRLVEVIGEVRWVPGPSPLPWLAGAALLAMAVVAAARRGRRVAVLVAALGLLVATDVVQVAGAWAGVAVPLAAKLPSVAASAVGWLVAGLAARQLLAGRLEGGLFRLLLAAGLLTAVGGLGDLGFLLSSQLAGALPDAVVRAAVAVKLGLGAGALAAAGLRLQAMTRDREPAAEEPPGAPTTAGWTGAGWTGEPPADAGWDDLDGPLVPEPPEPAGVPRLHLVGGRSRDRVPEPAAATAQGPATSATVLPWPGPRRPDPLDLDDGPDLPGGA
jgi:hypothetical protein